MEKTRNYRTTAIIALCVAVVGLSVAFAALSQTLTIEGTTVVRGSTWAVYFSELSEAQITGQAEIVTPASLNAGATTLTLGVALTLPGDSVTYTFNVRNAGTINATVRSITLSGVPEMEQQNIIYTLTYADGTAINPNDDLDAAAIQGLRLTITFDPTATEVPADEIPLSLGATITYGQR